jgi:hypothetical protein
MAIRRRPRSRLPANEIWVSGPGSYGRNDAGIDAALLSKAVGRPVRVQGMRYKGRGWSQCKGSAAQEPKVRRLTAGANGIRTIGPPRERAARF